MPKRSSLVLLTLFSVIYFSTTCTLATWKRMWSDEVLTYHLARLPKLADLHAALSDGPDASGPLLFLTVKGAYAIMGETPLATRLPAIIGVWVMMICLFVCASRRVPPAVAWLALLFPPATEAYLFMIEGRSYGLMMGATGLALLCRQVAAEGRARPWSVLGLTLSLALAVSFQYYAVLVFIPLGLAELARIVLRRKLDLPVGIALFAGLIPLAFFSPYFKNAKSYAVFTSGGVSWSNAVTFYDWLLSDALPPLIASLILVPLVLGLRSRPELDEGAEPFNESDRTNAVAETVAAAGFVLLPFFMVLLAKLAAGVTQNRYCLPTVIGFALLLSTVVGSMKGRRIAGSVIAIIFLGYFVANFAGRAAFSESYAHQAERGNPFAIPVGEAVPVATCDYHQFVESQYYMDAKKCADLTFITGLKDAITERMILKLKPWAGPEKPLLVADYRQFLADHDQFLVFGNPEHVDSISVLIARLKLDGAKVEFVEKRGVSELYRVSLPKSNP